MRCAALCLVLLTGCAARLPPVTKLVNGRVIVTRSVTPSAYEHASRALIYEEEERWSDAAGELQRALVYDNESPELHAELAEVFMRLDRPDDAATAVNASLAIEVTARGLAAQAHLRQLRGDAAGAVSSLEKATALVSFEDDGADAENTYLELGEAALLALDAGRARKALEALCAAAPESITGRLRLAALAWAQGDLRETERRLKEAVGLEPNQLDALLSLGTLFSASARPTLARAAFQDALDRSEGAPEVALAFARFLIDAGDRKAAEQLADDLPPVDPKDAETAVRRVELERVVKRFDRALAFVKMIEESDPPEELAARLPLIRAQVTSESGQRAQAVAGLLALPKDAPAYLDARLQAADILREDGKPAEAEKALAEGEVEGEGERPDVELAVARALVDERKGDSTRAARRLDEALARHAGNSRLLLALGALEERRGQWKRALELADRVLAKEPASVEALNFWGFVAADHNHELPLAMRRLVTALAFDAGTGSIIDSVGWVHLKTGDLPRAALFLEQAGRLAPEDAEVQSHLGELYLRRAEPDRARTALRKALSLHPEEALRRRLEDELARLESRKAARP